MTNRFSDMTDLPVQSLHQLQFAGRCFRDGAGIGNRLSNKQCGSGGGTE